MRLQIRNDVGQVVMDYEFDAGQAQVVAVAAPATATSQAVIATQRGWLRPAAPLDRFDRGLAFFWIVCNAALIMVGAARADGWLMSIWHIAAAALIAKFARRVWRALA
jgi:hypothetical protein